MIKPSQQLSQHFTLAEFVKSATAEKLKIDNSAPPAVLKNLLLLASFCEQVRTVLGHAPMLISSGYRCEQLNKAVGGVGNSSHLFGLACDFTANAFGSPYAICKKLADSSLLFDQLILERVGSAVWVHIGIAESGVTPRQQVLTIDKSGTRLGLWER